ncbi:MAG: cytochrome-c peroxidase [Ignavibacteria bacterium]
MKSILTSLFVATLLIACAKKDEQTTEKTDVMPPLTQAEQNELFEQAGALFPALPAIMPGGESDSPELVALGQELYHDTRLSVNNEQSCNTCHNVDNGGAGVDNETTSPGALGKRGARNTPSSLNAGFHFVQFWDGRAEDLEAQAKGPVVNPIEMGMESPKAVEAKLGGVESYKAQFASAFPNDKRALSFNNVAKAIAAFERTLVSPSRYDKWISGDKAALTPQEQRGLHTFINAGCIACHSGTTFGGSMYQKLGLVNPYPSADAGRFAVTKDPADSLMFKVPSLRNVAVTWPYFHDGSVRTLKEAIRLMAWHQVGNKLNDNEVASIEIFLKSLTNEKITATHTKTIASKM